MQAVILAAGKGKRLLPLTTNRSKAMIPVAGVPIIARIIDDLLAVDIHDILIVVRPDDDQIRPYLRQRFSARAAINFAVQDRPLGMGHALRTAAAHLRPPFLLTACDNLVDRDELELFIQRFQSQPELAALLSLLPVDPSRVSHTAVVSLQGDRILEIVEKPGGTSQTKPVASTPLYIFSKAITRHLAELEPSARGEYELQDVISALIAVGANVRGFFLSARRTLTSPEDLRSLTIHYLQAAYRQGALPIPPEYAHIRIVPPVLIEPGVVLGPGCVIGPNVYLENGVSIPPGAHIQDDFRLRPS